MSARQAALFAREERQEWVEVSQAVYDSWSAARQLAYCAARDEDTAAAPEQDEDLRAFCAARARDYRCALAEIVGQTLKASVLY